MSINDARDEKLKQTVKEALAETLQEQRELIREVVAEALEDLALAEAIREGRKTKLAKRETVLGRLQAKR